MTEGCFFEIGAQSNFSFLQGAAHPEEMVETAQEAGIAGIGLADRNTVAGVVRMHAAAKARNYPFRAGARLVFADETPELLVYPLSRRGWGHLCRLLSAGNLRSEKGVCTLFEKDLREWNADLLMIALSPPLPGGDSAGFVDRAAGLARDFHERFYLALVPRYDGLDAANFAWLKELGGKFNIPLIATNLPSYHKPERKPLADVVTAIREHVPIAEAGFRLAANAERHLKGWREMMHLMRLYPEAITATADIFSRLTFSLDELSHQYPDESIGGEPADKALRRLAYEGATKRYPGGIPEKVASLLEYELNLIAGKRYEPYFLTVYRIVTHARKEGILCQGRGSAANSAVCYCLGITEVNPERTTLLFDRFISTERDEPPDIDVDFEHEKREEVIKFIYKTYGREHAALTAAVICYRARMAGREVAKAFGFSEDVRSALTSNIWGWSSDDLSEREAAAAGLDASDKTTNRLLHYASSLIGFPRHLSQHVGGFVITRDRLDEVVPIMNTADGRYMIEWDKDDLDTLRILKIDVLALGMLTCLARALKLLEDGYGVKTSLADIMEDQQPVVYDMICRADTIGTFQIESRAQMSMLPRLRPREFYDLVIEVAIVRPGPIQGNMVHPYLKRREEKRDHGREPTYPKAELIPVLKRTLGVPLFQEQAMQIAITAAGFTPAEADQLRRAMATFRRTGQVSHFQRRMVDGMVERGYAREFAERCFSQIEGFGEYGFPESHAASFALLVYASCWFKAFYPDIFCAAMLNSQPMGFYPPAQLVRDAREHGVEVRPADVNHSLWESSLEAVGCEEGTGIDVAAIERRHSDMVGIMRTRYAVRLGLSMIKGFSKPDADRLEARRGAGYESPRDLWRRTGLDQGPMEKLADADAFRSTALDRRAALWEVKALEKSRTATARTLFDTVAAGVEMHNEAKVSLPEMPAGEHVLNDYRSLSLSLKAHPVSFLRTRLDRLGIVPSRDLERFSNGSVVSVAGLVLVRQRPGSAKGVVFMTLEDETGVANAIVWKKVFSLYRPIVMGARFVRIDGRLQKAHGVIHVVADRLTDMTAMLAMLQEESRPDASQFHPPVENAGVGASHGPAERTSGRLQPSERRISSGGSLRHLLPKGRNFH